MVENVEENVFLIKRYLDEMVEQFKVEIGYVSPAKPVSDDVKSDILHNVLCKMEINQSNVFPEPQLIRKEWQSTPILDNNPANIESDQG